MLDEDQSLGAMKIKIKVERAIKKGKINLPLHLKPVLPQVYKKKVI